MTSGDSSDAVEEVNPSDVVAVWGFLVDSSPDANWTASRHVNAQTTDANATSDGDESETVWTAGVVFRVVTISVLMLLTLAADAADPRRQHPTDSGHRQSGVAASQAGQRIPTQPGRRRPDGLSGDDVDRDTVRRVRRVGARTGRLQAHRLRPDRHPRVFHVPSHRHEHRQVPGRCATNHLLLVFLKLPAVIIAGMSTNVLARPCLKNWSGHPIDLGKLMPIIINIILYYT